MCNKVAFMGFLEVYRRNPTLPKLPVFGNVVLLM
jgi:hypothetical protein